MEIKLKWNIIGNIYFSLTTLCNNNKRNHFISIEARDTKVFPFFTFFCWWKTEITIANCITLVFNVIVLPVSQQKNYCNYSKNTTIIQSTLQLASTALKKKKKKEMSINFWQFILEVKNEKNFYVFFLCYNSLFSPCLQIFFHFILSPLLVCELTNNGIKYGSRRRWNCSLWFPLINQALLSSLFSIHTCIYISYMKMFAGGVKNERKFKFPSVL